VRRSERHEFTEQALQIPTSSSSCPLKSTVMTHNLNWGDIFMFGRFLGISLPKRQQGTFRMSNLNSGLRYVTSIYGFLFENVVLLLKNVTEP
jgi:hypothetical protein